MDEFTRLKALFVSKLDTDAIRASRKICEDNQITGQEMEGMIIENLLELLKVDKFDIDMPEMIEINILEETGDDYE